VKLVFPGLLAFLFVPGCLSAAEIKGKVVDPSGAPIVGAQVSIVSRVGVEAQTASVADGSFVVVADRALGAARLVVTAPGFRTASTAPSPGVTVRLEIAPQVDSVRVVGSTLDVPAAEQGGSVSIIPREEVRERNEPIASELLRYLPGLTLNQSGAAGGATTLFIRGGNTNFGLVQIDGVPVVAFGGGLGFDFAHIPAAAIDHIEVIRGAQSAVYGPYANSGVVDFVTRQPESGLHLEVLAEGGTYQERRFGITAAGTAAGFGIAASASRLDTEGPVANNDYRNEDILLHITRRFGRQRVALGGYFDSSEAGEPGPWGSNPKGTFTGIDTISRAKNNFTDAYGRYEIDLSDRFREELSGSFFQNNNGYSTPYGFSFNKDQREQGDARTTVVLGPHDVAAFGVWAAHEEVTNTFIADAAFSTFPIGRNDLAVYGENRFEFRGRLFLNTGVRAEWIRTPEIPPDGFSRPLFPANNIARVNPKIAVSGLLAPGTRAHASFGLGLRPPNGFELAFTNNPSLKPERTRSFDMGIEQKLAHDRVLLDATYFYNRYYDLIVTLGGSLKSLSRYQSANLANSRAQGVEFSANVRPSRWLFVTGAYTYLATRILSLEGSPNLAPAPFQVGQQLTRRPENSGSVVATFTRGRVAANVTGYFRGKTLFEEPSFGASNGLFWDAGFANVGLNLNYRLVKGVTAYGHLCNALNRYYEEVFGYPSPRLNFVAGLKWELP